MTHNAIGHVCISEPLCEETQQPFMCKGLGISLCYVHVTAFETRQFLKNFAQGYLNIGLIFVFV
jgi:hypothetical protein